MFLSLFSVFCFTLFSFLSLFIFFVFIYYLSFLAFPHYPCYTFLPSFSPYVWVSFDSYHLKMAQTPCRCASRRHFYPRLKKKKKKRYKSLISSSSWFSSQGMITPHIYTTLPSFNPIWNDLNQGTFTSSLINNYSMV